MDADIEMQHVRIFHDLFFIVSEIALYAAVHTIAFR